RDGHPFGPALRRRRGAWPTAAVRSAGDGSEVGVLCLRTTGILRGVAKQTGADGAWPHPHPTPLLLVPELPSGPVSRGSGTGCSEHGIVPWGPPHDGPDRTRGPV